MYGLSLPDEHPRGPSEPSPNACSPISAQDRGCPALLNWWIGRCRLMTLCRFRVLLKHVVVEDHGTRVNKRSASLILTFRSARCGGCRVRRRSRTGANASAGSFPRNAGSGAGMRPGALGLPSQTTLRSARKRAGSYRDQNAVQISVQCGKNATINRNEPAKINLVTRVPAYPGKVSACQRSPRDLR